MPDREKVIKGLKCHISSRCTNCPYQKNWGSCSASETLFMDILAMLKEQEPVKPAKEYSGGGVTWWYVCGDCLTAINPNDKYCHECGKKVKWND